MIIGEDKSIRDTITRLGHEILVSDTFRSEA